MKPTIYLLATAALCFGQQVSAAPTWVADKAGHAPQGAIVGGSEPGRNLIVCRAKYQNGSHPGKLVASNCNIGWGGKEITLPAYEVLTGDPKEIQWVKGQNGSVPTNAFIGGEEPGRKLPVCRGSHNGGIHPGKIVAKNCNIGWGGKEILLPTYEVMVVAAATQVTTSTVPTTTVAAASCSAGQELLDGKTCVTLAAWPNKTPLPDGSKIAIKLRKVNRNYSGGSEPWPRWIGVSTKDNATIDAVDEKLTSRNIFEIKTFYRSGWDHFGMPWFIMKASNGKYVGGRKDGSGKLGAMADEPNADIFDRSYHDGANFVQTAYQWKDAEKFFNGASKGQGYRFYEMCLSPFNVGSKLDGIGQWLNGGNPNYGCYVSGKVDFYVVK